MKRVMIMNVDGHLFRDSPQERRIDGMKDDKRIKGVSLKMIKRASLKNGLRIMMRLFVVVEEALQSIWRQ
jgi:hypothetical protein